MVEIYKRIRRQEEGQALVEYALILYATKSLATEGMATFRAMYRTWASTR